MAACLRLLGLTPAAGAVRAAIAAYDHDGSGTIEVRLSWTTEPGTPSVVNIFAQWELGLALKYNRIPCPQSFGSDSAENREAGFQQCLDAISDLKTRRPNCIAFPHGIACGLGGGDWSRYRKMIGAFALANPNIWTYIVRWGQGNPLSLDAMTAGEFLEPPPEDVRPQRS